MRTLQIKKGLGILVFFSTCIVLVAQKTGNDKYIHWYKDGITITIEEHLNIKEMSWPKTLLEYPVDFSGEPVMENELHLMDMLTGTDVPFQLVPVKYKNDRIESALLSFISDLPSGAKKQWKLEKITPSKGSPKQMFKPQVKIYENEELIEVDNGLVKMRIFKSKTSGASKPLLQIGTTERWLGTFMLPEHIAVQNIEIIEKSKGAVMVEYLIRCVFSDNRSYRIGLKMIADMEFIEMEENMEGFTEKDGMTACLLWDQFAPDYRYCPNRNSVPIDNKGKGYSNYNWEKITGSEGNPNAVRHPEMPYDNQNLPNGKMPFKITPYHNWMTWWRLHTAAFWDEQSGLTAGIFIKNFENWIDPAYPLWGSKDHHAIHFYYQNRQLQWRFPLVAGKRSIALALYPHQKDIDLVNRENYPMLHVDYLRRWYGWLSLNKTKDWILNYTSERPVHPAFFKSEFQEAKFNPKDLLATLKRQVSQMAKAGERSNYPTPVGTRTYYENITPLFEHGESTLTVEEYRQARAWYLFMNYIFMDESLMPMLTMLSGHPNFLADIKGVPGLAAFLFPDHPQASEFADHFEKSIALNLRYHTRPDEPAWNAKGGRWTENLGCYTWAFLKPTLKTSFLLHHFYDDKNRILQPNINLFADWLLNGLTSPLNSENGKRVNPPQGAHSRGIPPSILLYMLGQEMRYYNPLLSEHLLWVSSPDDAAFEAKPDRQDPWDGPAKSIYRNTGGTNPHLKSAKYTGYGVNMRSEFGKPEEMYVHLQQIDAGPNYRWGRAAKGGNGVIYYYADGKRYSHNGIEDVGDAPFGDTERCTNFGVKKNKSYRSIGDFRSVGMNELTEPLYDFGFAQFASVLANEEAAPEYRSRSVLMSGSDYILIYDDVKDHNVEGRFSWFVGKDDNYPYIHQLTPGVKYIDANIQPSNTPYHKDPEILPTKGRYYDGKGDFLTMVTHKANIQPVADNGAYKIAKPDGSTEWVFCSDDDMNFDREKMVFKGRAGLIKRSKDGKSFEAALFQGKKIGVPGIIVELDTSSHHNGMSLKKNVSGYSGIFSLQKTTKVRFTVTEKMPKGMVFYLDGIETSLIPSDKGMFTIIIQAGKYDWQWTNNGVIPQQPVITGSVTGVSHCLVQWAPVNGAVSYLIQKSADGGIIWETIAENIRENHYRLSELTAGTKIHVRVIAKGNSGQGKPAYDYPVYPSADRPHKPEGLRAVKNGDKIELNWGQILGAGQYVLYQRKKGTTVFEKVYTGDRSWASIRIPDGDIYEFAVTAINDNGESEKSYIADTNPDRIINWYPVPGEIFRRDTESHENGYIEYNHWIEQEMPVLKYPFQIDN